MANVVININARDNASVVLHNFSKAAQQAFRTAAHAANQGAQIATAVTNKMDEALKRAVRNFINLKIASSAFRAVSNVVRGAANDIIDFDAAIARIGTLGPEAISHLGQFRKEILDLPPNLGSATDNARALFEALTKGAEPARAMEIVTASAKAAEAGLADVGRVASIVNQIIKSYGEEAGTATEILDKLFRVTQTGNITFDNLAGVLGQSIGIASQLGVRFEDAANAIAQIAIVTGKAQTAQTGFRQILSQVIQNIDEFRKRGIDAFAILRGENGFVNLMRKLQEVTGGSSEKMRVFIKNIRGLNAAGITTGQLLNKLAEEQVKVANATGTVEEAFQQQEKSLRKNFSNVANAFEQMVNKLAGDDTSAIVQSLKSIEVSLTAIGNAGPQINARLLSLAFVFNLAASAATTLLSSLTNIIGAIPRVTGTLTDLIGRGLKSLGTKLSESQNDFDAWIGKVLTGGGNAARKFGDTQDEVGKKIQGVGDTIQSLTEGALAAAEGNLDSIAANMAKVGEAGKKLGDDASSGLYKTAQSSDNATKSVQATTTSVNKLSQSFVKVENGRTILTNIREDSDRLSTSISRIGPESSKSFSNMSKSIGGAKVSAIELSTGIDLLGGKSRKLSDNLDVASSALNGVDQKLEDLSYSSLRGSEATTKLSSALRQSGKESVAFLQVIGKAPEQVRSVEEAFSGAFETTREELETLGKTAVENFGILIREGKVPPKELQKAFDKAVKDVVALLGPNNPIVKQIKAMKGQIADAAGDTADEITNQFKELGISIQKPIENGVSKAINAFQSAVSSGDFTKNQLQSIWKDTADFIISQGGRLPQAFQAKFGEVTDAAAKGGKDAGDAFAKGFKRGTDAVKEELDTVTRALKDASDRASDIGKNIKTAPLSFDISLPNTVEGLEKFIRDTQVEISRLWQNPGASAPGFVKFTRERLEEVIKSAQDKIKELKIADKELNDRFDAAFGGNTQSNISTVNGQIQELAREINLTALGADGLTESLLSLSQVQGPGIASTSGGAGANRPLGVEDTDFSLFLQENTNALDKVSNGLNALDSFPSAFDAVLRLPTDELASGVPIQPFGSSESDLTNSLENIVVPPERPDDSLVLGSPYGNEVFQTVRQSPTELGNQSFLPPTTRGSTSIQVQPKGRDMSAEEQLEFSRLSAQGRTNDVMGNTAQRTIAKAVVPVTRTAIRNRQVTGEITRETALTRKGKATTK